MAVKAVEMVRKIRDSHYEETKRLSVDEQIKFVKKKAEKLQKELKIPQSSTVTSTVHVQR
ncbi:MAG: hypothetical protein AB1393_07945 [Candidatus Edwardsbacteria bacterium]